MANFSSKIATFFTHERNLDDAEDQTKIRFFEVFYGKSMFLLSYYLNLSSKRDNNLYVASSAPYLSEGIKN